MRSSTQLPFTFALAFGALAFPTTGTIQVRDASPTYTITTGFIGAPTSVAPASCTGITAGTTDNDLINGVCKNLTLIFARGTFENGNFGGILGPPFFDALVGRLGQAQVAAQGVNDYPADVQGFQAGGSVTGSQNMAALIGQAMNQCPETKLCVSGYSQGAQVVHDATNLITQSQTEFINSVVLFGDPDYGEPVGKVPAARISSDCHVGDNICQQHGDLILAPHLDYCLDVNSEASYVIQRSGLESVS